jgi:hypothetical protein
MSESHLNARQNIYSLAGTIMALMSQVTSDVHTLDEVQDSLNIIVEICNRETSKASVPIVHDISEGRTAERAKRKKPLKVEDFEKKAEKKTVEFAEDEKPIKAKRGRKAKSAEA